MKNLYDYIQEGILDNVDTALKNADYNIKHKYFPKTKNELKDLVNKLIKKRGNEADLNDIDTSKITDMSYLFAGSDFNGDISEWDVSNVTNMYYMFNRCRFFNKPLNNWNVNKVRDMSGMFDKATEFNQPLNNWKLSDAVTVDMFHSAYNFKQDLSSWDLRHTIVSRRRGMFTLSKMTQKYLPRFK